MTTPGLIQPVVPETDSGFKIGSVTPSAIFTRFGTERFSPLLAPKRRSMWMCHFRSDEEIKEAVHDWLAQQPKDFSRGIYASVERGGDYTENWCHCTVSVFCTQSLYIICPVFF
jgi:hypothetical protein